MNKTFDWQEFLRFAKEKYAELASVKELDNATESLCRIGISRAYYAAYHAARDYLLELVPNFSSGIGEGSHQALIKAFLHLKGKYQHQIGSELSYLKDMRVRADYDERRYNRRGELGNAVSELRAAINFAEKILKIIERCKE